MGSESSSKGNISTTNLAHTCRRTNRKRAIIMLTDKEIDEAAQRVTGFRRSDPLTGILDGYETLLQSYRRLKSDYEEEREARERYKQLARGQERNPFVLVLVDADGYVFHDNLIKAGAEGGSLAAQRLNDTIRDSLRRKNIEHCDVVIRVYANVAGLSKALAKAGLVGAHGRSMTPFIANFNRSYPLTDFVDAGELKENADFKVRGLLRLYAENAQCKHVYFAACHDAGYVSELTPYRNQHERFTLVKTSGLHFHDEFSKLGLPVEELPGVFRAPGSAMDAFYPKPFQPATNGSAEPKVPATPKSQKAAATGPMCQFALAGRCKYGSGCKFTHPDNSQTSTPPVGNSTTSLNWRKPAQGAGPSNGHEIGPGNKSRDNFGKVSSSQSMEVAKLLPKKEDIPEDHVAVNKDNHRLDYYIPEPTPEAEGRLKARSTSRRLCNAKHIAGRCDNPSCEYDHRPLEEDLKPVLEWLSRTLPCMKRGACRNARCTSGHICQKGPSCKYRGGKAFCRLGFQCHIDNLAVDRYVPASTPGPTGSLSHSVDGDDDGDDDCSSCATHESDEEGEDGATLPVSSNGTD